MFVILLFTLIGTGFADFQTANQNVTPFDEVDSDGNGEIDFNEFEKWQKVKQGTNDEQTVRAIFQKYDTSRDGKMDVSEFVVLAYDVSKKPEETTEQIFRKMDLNGDSIVDASEVLHARKEFDEGIIDGVLAIADTNRDGQLSFEEFEAQLKTNKPKAQSEVNRETAAQLMAFIDVNGDQKINAQEIHNFASQFSKISVSEVDQVVSHLDLNGDGFITVDELEKLPTKVSGMLSIQTPPKV